MRKNYFLKSMLSLLLMFVGINAWAQDETIDLSTQNYTNAQLVSSTPGTNCKITYTDGSTKTAYYTTGLAVRIYGGGSFTVSSTTKQITNLTLTYDGSDSPSDASVASNGTLTVGSNVQTWVSSLSAGVSSVTFTRPTGKGHWRLQKVAVTYASAGGDKTATHTAFGAGAQNSYDIFIGEGFTAPTATVDNSGTVTYGSSSTSVATVDPNTGAVTLVAPGSTTITASYAGDDTYAASSASYVLNVGGVYNSIQELQAGATTTSSLAKITFNNVIVTGIKNTSTAYISDGQYGAMIYTSGHGLTAGKVLNGTIVAKVVLYGGATEITNFTTNGLTITDGILTPTATTISSITLPNQSNYIQLNNVTYDATEKTFTDGTSTIAFYDGLTTGMTLVDGVTYNITGVVGCYNKLQVFPAIAEALPTNVAISAAQYATYVAPFDINISKSDVEAYTVNLLDGAYAVLTPVTLIPKWSVILLKGTEGTHALYSDATQTYTALTDNLLVASTTDVIADGSQYILAMPAGSPVGFYRANSGSTIHAGKGYLSIPLTPTAKFLGFTFDTTGIDKVNASTENNVIYNLNGQKISAPVKGVNIINGKKVVVK